MTEQMYPLIIHLPLLLFLKFFYKYRWISAITAIFVAYLCCQISNWMGLLFLNITHFAWVYYSVRIFTTITVFGVLTHFVSFAIAQFLQKKTRDVAILSLMPFVYYVYDYLVTVYSELLYSGMEVVFEFLAFMLCIFYVLFLFIYFKQYEEKQEMEQRNRLLEIQRVQSEKEVEMMKHSEYMVSILRHDMRHYLNDIAGFIENGENDCAQRYISEIIVSVEQTVTKKYCSNKIVNMILSTYENTIKEYEIDFTYSIRIPSELAFSDSDISSILSNSLENAVKAVSFLEQSRRKIEADLCMKGGKLLISIKNTYAEKPTIIDGMPQAKKMGHGFGTQSIRYVVEKLKGNCQFTVDDEYFILRIVL